MRSDSHGQKTFLPQEKRAAHQAGMPSPWPAPESSPEQRGSGHKNPLRPMGQGAGVGCRRDSCSWGDAKEKTQVLGFASDSGLALFSVALEGQRFLLLAEITEQSLAVSRSLMKAPETLVEGWGETGEAEGERRVGSSNLPLAPNLHCLPPGRLPVF